jgi:hypothetical protein
VEGTAWKLSAPPKGRTAEQREREQKHNRATRIVTAYKEGKNFRELRAMFGVRYTEVCRALAKAGVVRPVRTRKPTTMPITEPFSAVQGRDEHGRDCDDVRTRQREQASRACGGLSAHATEIKGRPTLRLWPKRSLRNRSLDRILYSLSLQFRCDEWVVAFKKIHIAVLGIVPNNRESGLNQRVIAVELEHRNRVSH